MGEKIQEYLSPLRSWIKLLFLSFIALKLPDFTHVTYIPANNSQTSPSFILFNLDS